MSADAKTPDEFIALMEYVNHRGEAAVRRITPVSVFFGQTQFYPLPQPLMRAWDHDKKDWRTFALAKVRRWITGDAPAATRGPEEKGYMASDDGRFRYPAGGDEPAPLGAKVQILTEGGICIHAIWQDDSGFIAWAPLPKRDHEREAKLFPQRTLEEIMAEPEPAAVMESAMAATDPDNHND
jgi:hypothetical protein